MKDQPFAGDPETALLARLTRPRFCGLIVALGTSLGLGSVTHVTAARCRKKSARCSRNDQCCSQRCKRGFCYPRRH
jgi:hypothetical protein